jgi:hypothetical protein
VATLQPPQLDLVQSDAKLLKSLDRVMKIDATSKRLRLLLSIGHLDQKVIAGK